MYFFQNYKNKNIYCTEEQILRPAHKWWPMELKTILAYTCGEGWTGSFLGQPLETVVLG
jgi:hypothetical protein